MKFGILMNMTVLNQNTEKKLEKYAPFQFYDAISQNCMQILCFGHIFFVLWFMSNLGKGL